MLAGAGPFPSPGKQLHPVLEALVLDRQQRETKGAAGITETTPLLRLRGDPEFGPTAEWFVKEVMAPAYAGPSSDADAGIAARTAEVRSRNAWLAVGAVLLFVAAAAVVALRTRKAA